MEQNWQDLRGMSAEDAKEYLFRHISVLKLTEKKYRELDGEIAKWDSRAALAASRASPDLAREAEAEALRHREKQAGLGAEIAELKAQIEGIRRQLPGLAARERSIDPDLLEQELLITLGKVPGDTDDTNNTSSTDGAGGTDGASDTGDISGTGDTERAGEGAPA
jgi:chromosome segregation ATPase